MFKILNLMALALLAIVNAVETEDGVLVLTDANFDEVIAQHEFLLVEFYAPWCGHCKKLAPEYSAAAEVLSKNSPPYALAKVDATAEKATAEKFGIQGFPTLFFFRNGEKTEYTGGRTKDTIVSWVLKKAGPPSTKVTCDQLKTKVADNKFALAYFGAEDSDMYKNAHVAYATAEDKIQFFHADAECGKTYGAESGIVFFRKFETTENVYSGAADKEALQAFVKPLMVPIVFEFGEDEIEAIFGQQQNTLFLFRSSEKDKDAKFMATFEEAAKANKGKMLFAYSDIKDGIQSKLAEFMGLTEDQLPVMRAITPADMKKFQSETKPADLTVDIITKFVDDVLAGKVSAHLKSEAIPEKNDEEVKVVVGKSFDAIVKDETKDVFVKYYAPWCGHCKKLAPIWEELGAAYKDEANVVIAKFDSTANEAEGVEVRGFPTLIFYPAGNKAGVNYEGERDLESFKKWIDEHKTQAGQKTEL